MTDKEAKFILSAFRPGGGDTGNPAFADALRMAAADPAMGAWLARSRAHDAAVAQKIGQIAPPAGLREAILAGGRVSGRHGRGGLRLAWVAGVAAAASLAFVVATMRVPVRPDGEPAGFAGFAINDVANGKHGSKGGPANTLIAQLQAKGAPMPGADQIDLEKLRDTGCRTLTFAGREVLEVCFVRNGATFHFYVTRRDGAAGDAAKGPAFISQAGGAAAVWSDRRFEYVVASAAGVDAIRRLF